MARRSQPEAPARGGPRGRSTRSYLRASDRRTHLLDAGAAIVREKGWENLTIVDLARRAGVSRQLVHQYFGDLERLALALAERFQDEVYEAAAAAIERHPNDLAAAMGETLERFLVGLREHRLAYVDLFTAHSYRRRLHSPLRAVNHRKRRRLVDIWARYYEQAYDLAPADAVGLASFQYDGLRGLVSQVDAGSMPAQEAIRLVHRDADRRGRAARRPAQDAECGALSIRFQIGLSGRTRTQRRSPMMKSAWDLVAMAAHRTPRQLALVDDRSAPVDLRASWWWRSSRSRPGSRARRRCRGRGSRPCCPTSTTIAWWRSRCTVWARWSRSSTSDSSPTTSPRWSSAPGSRAPSSSPIAELASRVRRRFPPARRSSPPALRRGRRRDLADCRAPRERAPAVPDARARSAVDDLLHLGHHRPAQGRGCSRIAPTSRA